MLTGSLRPYPVLTAVAAQAEEWSSGSGIGSLVAVILTLALIIVLIILLIRFLASRNQFWSRAGAIRHLGGIGVGQHKSVQLVQVGEKLYVIGVGNDIRLLDTIDDEAEIREILDSLAPAPVFSGARWLSALRDGLSAGKRRGSGTMEEEELEHARFQELLNTRIRELGTRSGKLKERLAEEEADGRRP
jgi:flagellar protein FliO/FliZ